MTLRAHPSALSRVFTIGLALAASHCGGEAKSVETPDPTSAATTTASATAEARKPTTAQEILAQLQKVEFAATTESGVEYLGFATFSAGALTCPQGPCPKEWRGLVKKPDVQHLIARKDGALVAVTVETFVKVLGPIASPAEAVMFARVAGQPLARCAARGDHLECRPANDGSGLLDPKFTDRFVLATVVPFECPGGAVPSSDRPFLLRFIRVDADGTISNLGHPLAARAAAHEREDKICPPQRMRGRRFEGYCDAELERSVLEYLIRAHREEAAAVLAFERLAADLARFHAPASLVERAHSAAREERRHAAVFLAEARALATELGTPLSILPLDEPAREARALDAVLLENAVEGCANETAAAIVATYQASVWPDARLRPALECIASDERSHALLAYEVYSWGQTVLDPTAADRVEAARIAAVERSFAEETSSIATALGEPDAALVARALRYVAQELARAA